MIWSIPHYEGYYASTDGVIYTTKRSGSKRADFPIKPLKTWRRGRRKDYLAVLLYRDGKRERWNVHQLVMKTFNPSNAPKLLIRHINDIPTDNRFFNLAWGSRLDNRLDMWRNYRIYKEHYQQKRALSTKRHMTVIVMCLFALN